MAQSVKRRDEPFWEGRRVLVTGHTGFKGSWLCLWLRALGAEVTGYALPASGDADLFVLSGARDDVRSVPADIRHRETLARTLREAAPEVIFHMAAQPLVRKSYTSPGETFDVNVMGTVRLLEAVKEAIEGGIGVRALVNVTSDKCYENREWLWGYRENDPLGGYDPYSGSKACSELVTAAFRSSFFPPARLASHGLGIATARAGNVIGGGDRSPGRLIPDCFRALRAGTRLTLRSPRATRPWQHVLEPLHGYLLLARKLAEDGAAFSSSWNFGPDGDSAREVEWIVRKLGSLWGAPIPYDIDDDRDQPYEAGELRLDSSKARRFLGWQPRWNVEQALAKTVEWHRVRERNEDVRAVCLRQIAEYMAEQHEGGNG